VSCLSGWIRPPMCITPRWSTSWAGVWVIVGSRRLAAFLSRETLVVGLVVGLVGGLMFGLAAGFIMTAEDGPVAALGGGLIFGLVGGLVLGLVGGLVVALTRSGVDDTTPAIPRTSWRNDLRHGFVLGLVSGLGSGLVFWLVVGFADGFGGSWRCCTATGRPSCSAAR
jgi:hypothetical protein